MRTALLVACACAWPAVAVKPLSPVYQPVALGSVRATGWLASLLRLQLRGLHGHLSVFWPDVQHSTLPYWLNGAVPLAYLLPDEAQSVPYAAASAATAAIATARRLSVLRQDAAARFSTLQAAAPAPATFSLRGEVSRVVDAILHAQSEAGWLGGPENDDPSNGDQYWVAWEVLWSLLQLAEAEPARRAGVRSALLAHVAEAHRRMEAAPLDGWSAVRWPEYGAILQAVGDAFGDEVGEAGAALLAEAYDRVAAQGFDWLAYFSGGGPAPSFNASLPFAPAWTLTEHGVNHAMALKEGAVAWRAGGGGAALDLTALKLRLLDRFHGQPTGVFSADECLGGLQPNRGVELCVTVELLFSLALLARTHGSVEHLDRMERIAFNALPGAVSEDFWAHNYLSQPNEIFAGRTEPHVWRTDPGDATVYGLAPTYGCCTANFGQGWPKFAASALGHNGSAVFVALYVPATATFPASVGGGATVRVATRYPFGDDVELDVSGVTAPAGVTLMLRIPAWPGAATVWSSSASPSPPSPSSRPAARPRRGTWHAVACPPPGCRVLLRLSSKVTLSPAGDPAGGGGVAVHRGPLLFALPLEEAWTLLRADPAQPRAADWQVSTPSDWALALVLNLAAPAGGGVGALGHDMVLEHAEDEDEGGGSWGGYAAGAAAGGPPLEPASPFAASRPRVWLRARARAVDAWRSPDGGRTAGPLPASPVCAPPPNATTGGGDGCGPERTVRLVPFGNTRLRVAVLPYTLRTG